MIHIIVAWLNVEDVGTWDIASTSNPIDQVILIKWNLLSICVDCATASQA